MSVADWVVLGLLALCVAAVVFFLRRQKRRGGGCAGCSGCAGRQGGGCGGCPSAGPCRRQRERDIDPITVFSEGRAVLGPPLFSVQMLTAPSLFVHTF